ISVNATAAAETGLGTAFKDAAAKAAALTNEETKLTQAQNGLLKLQGQQVVTQQQLTQVGKDYIDKFLIPENSLILESIPALQKKIDAVQLETATLGLQGLAIQQV